MGGVIHIALLLILYSLLAAAPCSLLRNETEDSAFPANSRALITRLIGGIYCLEGGESPLGDFASQSHYPHAWERTPSYAPTGNKRHSDIARPPITKATGLLLTKLH